MQTAERVRAGQSITVPLRRALETFQPLENRGVTDSGFALLRSQAPDGKLLTARVASLVLQAEWYGGGGGEEGLIADAMRGRFFGPVQWRAFFNLVPYEMESHPISWRLEELMGPCSFTPGKRIIDTHFLYWWPQEVDGKPFTPRILQELLKGYSITLFNSDEADVRERYLTGQEQNTGYADDSWRLVFLGPVPGSLGAFPQVQQALLPKTLSSKPKEESYYFETSIGEEVIYRTFRRLLIGHTYGRQDSSYLIRCWWKEGQTPPVLGQDPFGNFLIYPLDAMPFPPSLVGMGASRGAPSMPF